MSTTLTNGLKLPDKGSVDWYADMQSNYTILDGAVGTIAEHTTALSGKAPLVHTHTKADITDFPAYGTTAGTICEGNDSRLSDARTPVAHTHLTADVTDLLNGNHTWSGNNIYTATIKYQTSYTLGNPPQSVAAQSAITVTDSAGTNYLAQISTYQDTALSGLRFTIRDKFDSNGFSPSGSNRNKYLLFLQGTSNKGYLQWDGYVDNSLSPLANNTYDLGNSTLRWKTINGINPGALSLPVRGYTDSISLDTTNWDYAGNGFSISMTDNNGNYIPGWVVIVAEDVGDAFDYIKVRTTSYTRSPGLDFATLYTGSHYNIKACFPIDSIMYLVLKLTNGASCIKYARYYPCIGNV